MRDVPFAFFLAAVICVTIGMCLGIWMGPSGNLQFVPVHVHLNLVGWATLALFGLYYRVTPQAARSRLAHVHAYLALIGTFLMISGLAGEVGEFGFAVALLLGNVVSGETANTVFMAALVSGSIMTVLSMLLFLFTVIRHGFGAGQAATRSGLSSAMLTPAE